MSERQLPADLLLAAGEHVSARLVELAREMRKDGVGVGHGQLLAAHRALAVIDPSSPKDSAAALQCVLCAGAGDIPVFRSAFAAVFGLSGRDDFTTDPPRPWNAPPAVRGEEQVHGGARESKGGEGGAAPQPASERGPRVMPAPAAEGEAGDGETEIAAWSAVEVLREKDFGTYGEADEELAAARLHRLAAALPRRRCDRLGGNRRRGRSPATRQLLRNAVRNGGELTELRWRQPTVRPRRLVLLCDVSASMEPYTRMLLRYMHSCVRGDGDVEAFVFGTRLSRITRELRRADFGAALTWLSSAVPDAAAGTRIGAAIGELNRKWGGRIGRGAVVVVLSDGWDRGEPELLGAELARLKLCSHRLVWLNPLSAHRDYEPLARGMREALPHIDELAAGNALAALERLALSLDERRDREGDHRDARSLARAG